MSIRYRTTITQDHHAMKPSEWHWLVQVAVDKNNRYLGGLYDKTADRAGEWLFTKPLYAYVHGGVKLSTSPFVDPFDSGQVGWVGIAKENALVEGLTAEDHEKMEQHVKAFIDDWNTYLAGDVWNVLIESTEDGVHFDFVDSVGGCMGWKSAEEDAESMIADHKNKIEGVDDNAI